MDERTWEECADLQAMLVYMRDRQASMARPIWPYREENWRRAYAEAIYETGGESAHYTFSWINAWPDRADVFVRAMLESGRKEATLCAILRDIVGNPFRPVELPADHRGGCDAIPGAAERAYSHCSCPRRWVTPQVLSLALAAYEDRVRKGPVYHLAGVPCRDDIDDGTLDPFRLALLADALEEAGCSEDALLSHLRGPGPHVRGCWALELLRGVE